MDALTIADNNLLLMTLSGSHAYGMNTPTSDKDFRSIFYAPKNVIVSAFRNIEQVEAYHEKDSTAYELRKYVRLLVDQNPNILELLWVDRKFVLYEATVFKILSDEREAFLSSKAKFTFSGYALSQLKRIKGHNKWINNPQPARRPKEVDFVSVVWNDTDNQDWNRKVPFEGFEAFSLGADTFGLIRTGHNVKWYDIHEALIVRELAERHNYIPLSKKSFDLIVKFNKQLYREAVDNWQHYWTWKKERNETRSELEEKHGYDTKHAAHLIRLLRMGTEILRGEGVKVYRPDAQELLSIRNGSFTYEEVLAHAEDLDKEMESLYKITKLQHSVDLDKADSILRIIYETCWRLDRQPELKDMNRIGYKYISKDSTHS